MWILLVAATIAVYLNSLSNGFHNDDPGLILDNPNVRPPANPFGHFLTATGTQAEIPVRWYRPLVMVTYSLNYAWGGADVTGYHVVNISLHLATAILVVLLLWQLSGNRLTATFGGLLFALHPIHTEAVNYFTARSSVFYTLWSVLTLILFVRFRRAGHVSLLFAALVSFAAGLLTKETAIVMPVLLITYDVYFRGAGFKDLRRWIAPHVAFAAVSLAYLLLRRVMMGAFGPDAVTREISSVFLTFAVVFKKTLQAQLFPVHLSAFHPKNYETSLTEPEVAAACVILIGVVALSVMLHRRTPLLSFGLLWLPVGLLPIAGLAFITEMDLYQENRGYFSSVGLIMIVSPIIAACWGEQPFRERPAARVLVAGLVLAMALSVVVRNPVWRDPVTLWTDVAHKYPDDPSSLLILSRAHRLTGDPRSAIDVLRQATERLPPNANLYNDLCVLYLQEGALEEALQACTAAVRRGPKLPNPYFTLGTIYSRTGHPELAIVAYEQFLSLAGDQTKFGVLVREAKNRLDALRAAPAAH